MGDNISTVEAARYSGDKTSNINNFQRTSKEAYFPSKSDRSQCRPQVLTMADMVKELGYKNLSAG